jgi:hypothetical protein
VVVHVPADELDVLLKAQGRGVVVRYDEFAALRAAARAKQESAEGQPPVDGALLSAAGTLDLTDPKAATFELTYKVRGLAPGPRAIPFASQHVAFESVVALKSVLAPAAGGTGAEASRAAAAYEEKDGQGRLFLDGPGALTLHVRGSARPTRNGPQRGLDLTLPDAAAFALDVRIPPGVEATLTGEGPVRTVRSPAEGPLVVAIRPQRGGRVQLAWADAAKGTEGPSVLESEVKTLHTVGDGVVATSTLVKVDVLRTPTDRIVLAVPADLAIRNVEGPGVTGTSRSEDRKQLTVRLETARVGPVEVLVTADRPYQAGPGVELPRVWVVDALRQHGEVALRLASDLNVRQVRVEGGRRVSLAGQAPERAGLLRYDLASGTGGVSLDLEPGKLRVDATSTYYLNLAEPGQTLIATITYRVVEGTLFRLSPRFPAAFDLRSLSLNGATTGFRRDQAGDGTIEILLDAGVGVGGELQLLATLERAKADWLPEREGVDVPFAVPSAGVAREEGYVAVGADAGFEVLDAGVTGLLPVGAADLTARGLTSAGLVYGYRLDGTDPSVALKVTRREPLVTADVVTVLHPGPRRLDVAARAVYRIQRAGVRRLYFDVPTWAGDQVRFESVAYRAAERLVGDRRPADVPAGYDRWQVDLEQRVIGTHVVSALWFLDREQDNWKLEPDRLVAARVPANRLERMLVVRRATGLEVNVPPLAPEGGLRSLDVTELPPEAAVDPATALEVLRLTGERASLALGVTKHGGAAVLDAIATGVTLETAVGAEGILRTHAVLALFNVDRQFVSALLPPGSTLIGAVVDGVPVKPLVDPRGLLLVTVPTARAREQRTFVALTYDTPLGRAATGTVRIDQPTFPGLEVLHTSHLVAVEDGLEITGVDGDLRTQALLGAGGREPWLFGALARGLPGADRSALAPGSMWSTFEEDTEGRASDWEARAGYAAAPTPRRSGLEARESRRPQGPGGSVPPGMREPQDPTRAPPPAPGPMTPGAPAPTAPALMPAERPHGGMPVPEAAPDLHGVPAGDPAAGPAGGGGRPGGGAAGRSGPGEGGEAPPEPGFVRRQRKGQLSLDVPVTLGPVRVTAQRVGGGGSMEITLASKRGRDRQHQALALATLAVGLLVVWRRWLPGWLAVIAGALVAGCVGIVFGREGALVVAAVADGVTVLFGLLLLRAIARVLFGRRAPVAAAAALLVAFTLAVAPHAHADEAEDAAASSPSSPAGATVIVPHDPAKGTGLEDDARVFVPLAQWLELQRQAYPERDPELVLLGQVAALRSAAYRVVVGPKEASGTARIVIAQRGRGLLLVPLAFPGLAITEARLDGQPVRLLLEGAQYRVPLDREGEHVLELQFHIPLATHPWGRVFTWAGPAFAGSTLDVEAAGFDGDLFVQGAGRVEALAPSDGATPFHSRAYLGRIASAVASLVEKTPATLPAAVRTRAETRTIHSVRDGGTETVLQADLHVLQGRAPFVDFTLPPGVEVLEAGGAGVERWETSAGSVRLVFAAPGHHGHVRLSVRAFRAATAPERTEALPELAVRDTTGESGLVIVNGDPTLRLAPEASGSLFRTARPSEPDALGRDGQGRVLGGWRFATRPAPLSVTAERARARIEVRTLTRVTFGDDRVRSAMEAAVSVANAPVGDLVFQLPGNGEVRAVDAPDLQAWWIEGTGEERTLHVRLGELFEGERVVSVALERRLGGTRDGLSAPRLELVGSSADRGTLVLFALPDVDPAPGALPGLKALPTSRLSAFSPNVEGARPTHAYQWEEAVKAGLPLVLRTPEQEVEAVVVTQIAPSDEEQRLEHLVLFDVRRGATDRLNLFVPDGGGGLAENDVVRARDMREVRFERATRTDSRGNEIVGRLYSVRLQSPRSGLIEVTVAQLWPAAAPIPVVRPEGVVKATRWFSLVRTFLDGEVRVTLADGTPDPAVWADLPFVPTGMGESSVVKLYASRAPYTLGVLARRHTMKQQAEAVVLQALAEVVLGLDGEARVRLTYRIFNRARQFLRLKLPDGAVLFGAVAAGQPVKPLAGQRGTILLPVPKVPLGGTGYEVGITYRARAAAALHEGGNASLVLPQIEGAEVDRTAVALWTPASLETRVETRMSPAEERDVYGERAQVILEEVRDVLEVAQTGTLDQRLFACSNGAPLLEHAKEQVALFKNKGGRAEVVAGLEQEIRKLDEVNRVAAQQCRIDLGTAQNEVRLLRNLEAGANNTGQQLVQVAPQTVQGGLVDLDGVTNGLEERTAAGVGGGGGGTANWAFNPASVPLDKAGKDDLVELKKRLQSELERRDAEDRSKTVDVERETKERAAQAKDGGKSKAPSKKQVQADDETVRFDNNRNNLVLNDALRQVQERHGQLGGAGRQTITQGGQLDFAQQMEAGGDLSGFGIGPDRVILGAPLPPSSGVYFVDGDGDGDFRGRTENMFNAPLGQTVPTSRARTGLDFRFSSDEDPAKNDVFFGSPSAPSGGSSALGSSGGQTRVGLMGVDVDLPKVGRVSWFVAPKAGAPLALALSTPGTSFTLRLVTCLALVALVLLLCRALARRLAHRRPHAAA